MLAQRDPNPELSKDYFNRALGYIKSGDWQLAIELGIPTTHHDGRNVLAYAYGNRGYSYHYIGQYQTAINDFDKAIQIDPGFALTYINRATAYRNLGEYTLADADQTMACSLDSQWC
jgi:tetratricopeptide (TPR) repeat protein